MLGAMGVLSVAFAIALVSQGVVVAVAWSVVVCIACPVFVLPPCVLNGRLS